MKKKFASPISIQKLQARNTYQHPVVTKKSSSRSLSTNDRLPLLSSNNTKSIQHQTKAPMNISYTSKPSGELIAELNRLRTMYNTKKLNWNQKIQQVEKSIQSTIDKKHTEDLKKLKHLEETYVPRSSQIDALQSNIVKMRSEATRLENEGKTEEATKIYRNIKILENDIADNITWFQMREVEARKELLVKAQENENNLLRERLDDEIEKLEKKKKKELEPIKQRIEEIQRQIQEQQTQ